MVRNFITFMADLSRKDREMLKTAMRMFLDRDWTEQELEGEQACAREALHHLMELYITVVANGQFVSRERPLDAWIDYSLECREHYTTEEWFEYAEDILTVANYLMIAMNCGIDSL